MPTSQVAPTQVRTRSSVLFPEAISQSHTSDPTVFAGHDASRALGMTSTKAEDVRPDWYDLPEDQKKVLGDWQTFFSKRYNVVGKVEGATNL